PACAQDIVAYGQECAQRIAKIPPFDCRNGTVVPITVDGRTPDRYEPGMTCDRPALLPYSEVGAEGQCVPHSRALVLQDDAKAQVVAYCRQKRIRAAGAWLYDEVDIIAHDVETGSTCWFAAKAKEPLETDRGLDGRRVPSPDGQGPASGAVAARDFWQPPEQTAAARCVACHDSDPFMWSPWAAQTGQIPKDPFGKYANDIGAAFQRWPKPFGIATRGNACVGCHRIGSMETCHTSILQAVGLSAEPGEDQAAKRYPHSHWMPAGNWLTERSWDVTYTESVEQLRACCKHPEGAACVIVPITGGRS
ncbi:MAG: hypothetical protein ACM34L_02665, partial [Gemmatimonas sp.]